MAEERARKEAKGEMTVSEAGHKGGERTAETHGKEFYRDIGHEGGEKTAETHGHEFYKDIGHKGGQRERELVEEGKEAERAGAKRKTSESNR